MESLICPMINAQRQEVYTSLYRFESEEIQRLWDYKLIKADELLKKLLAIEEKIIVLGDGLFLLKELLKSYNMDTTKNIVQAHPMFSMPRASSIAAAGLCKYVNGDLEDCLTIKPFYIRKSSAEEKWEERHGAKG